MRPFSMVGAMRHGVDPGRSPRGLSGSRADNGEEGGVSRRDAFFYPIEWAGRHASAAWFVAATIGGRPFPGGGAAPVFLGDAGL